MDLRSDTLIVSRTLSELDREVIEFTGILDSLDIDYVIVSGYVAILAGRSRGTEDIDIVLESLDSEQVETLVARLEEEGYWGMAMPLSEMEEMLGGGDRMRIAEEGEMIPNFEVWFAKRDIERDALHNAIQADLGDGAVRISPIELQIAYKLRLAQQVGTTAGKDFEDALHLYETFEESLNTEELLGYVSELGVESQYDELQRA